MRVLVVGAGGVGDAFAKLACASESFEALQIGDISPTRAAKVASECGGGDRVSHLELDASSEEEVALAAEAFGCDFIVNACDPRFVMPIFQGALRAGVNYLDMAMSLSKAHPTDPYSSTNVMLGDEQFALSDRFAERGLLALVGMGVEPGLSDVFAAYASRHLFSRVEEFGVRDGANLAVAGYEFAPTFSIWTTIEECLNPPLIYERDRGFYTTAPFSEPEVFTFPEGIGEVECVNVEHEEVVLIPRYLTADRVTFKYGLGEEFISVLEVIHKLGLDATEPKEFRGTPVPPRDFLASLLPDPLTLGDKMSGKTCAGTWVKGLGVDGRPKELYLYHVVDNEETMGRYQAQAVVWQTAINPVIALELLGSKTWSGVGVQGPEAFDPVPFLDALKAHGSPWGVVDMTKERG